MQIIKFNFPVLMLIAMSTSFCTSQSMTEQNLNKEKTNTNMTIAKEKTNTNMTIAKEKTTEVNLKKGEVFIAFIPERKPNTDALFQAYLSDVFPVAMKHGAKPLANLAVNKTAEGKFEATDFIGFSSWPNQTAAAKFHEEMPPEKLDRLRRPIWSELKIFAFPIEEDFSFMLRENRTYEFKLLWGEERKTEQYKREIRQNNGKIAFDIPVVIYEDLHEGQAPNRVVLIEWGGTDSADRFRASRKIDLEKEEAFYSQLMIEQSTASRQKGITNHLTSSLDARPEEIWNILKTGGDVDKWFPFIKTCELRGSGVGAKRVCTTEDGKTLKEVITNIDNKNRVFEYVIESHAMEMPIKNIKGIMTVNEEDKKAVLDWKVTFDLVQPIEEDMLQEMKKGMVALMQTGADGLEQLVQ